VPDYTLATAPSNYRDLGGLPTRCGVLRDGVLMRGALYDGMEIPGVSSLHVVHLFDFRREDEAHGQPPPNVCHHKCPLHDPQWRAGHKTPQFYIDSALRLITAIAPVVVQATELLANQESVFVGCWLGKDRTGLMILLLGRLLGVDESTLVADYLKSSDNFAANRNWVQNYARDRGEDFDTVLESLCPSIDIPLGILAGFPSRSDDLCSALGVEESLVEKALQQSVAAPPCR
jgi:hypothetical protein